MCMDVCACVCVHVCLSVSGCVCACSCGEDYRLARLVTDGWCSDFTALMSRPAEDGQTVIPFGPDPCHSRPITGRLYMTGRAASLISLYTTRDMPSQTSAAVLRRPLGYTDRLQLDLEVRGVLRYFLFQYGMSFYF